MTIALASTATDIPAGPRPPRAAASSLSTAPFGSGPSAQLTVRHWAANASNAMPC